MAQEKTLVDQSLEVALQRPARRSRAQPFQLADRDPTTVEHMPEDQRLSSGQTVLPGEQMSPNRLRARSIRVSDEAIALVMENRGAKLTSPSSAGWSDRGGLRVSARSSGPDPEP